MRLRPASKFLYLLYQLSIAFLFFGSISACHNGKPEDQKTTTGDQISGTNSVQGNGKSNSDNQRIITIASWNIEWLGSQSNGPKNKSKQIQGAIKILKHLHADLYCLCEIVDPASLERLTRSLGRAYQYKLSSYASGANRPTDPGYAAAQKLAFIYDTSIFKNVQSSALLKSDPRAGYNFAGGRYPFLLQTDITVNQTKASLAFILLHAKAGADRTSYQRRLAAAKSLKKELDQNFAQRPVLIAGDFNDIVAGSITAGQPSPYQAFATDPNYHILTWTATQQKESSTLDYPTVIDQQIISAALNKYYVPKSTRIRTDVTSVIKDYTRGSVSDHYPVSSRFLFNKTNFAKASLKAGTSMGAATGQSTQDKTKANNTAKSTHAKSIALFQARVKDKKIVVSPKRKAENIQFILYNAHHHKVLSVHRRYINQGDHFDLRTPNLYPGHYELVIFCGEGKQVITFDK